MWWRVWPTLGHTSLLSQVLSFANVFSIRKATRGRVRHSKAGAKQMMAEAGLPRRSLGEGGF